MRIRSFIIAYALVLAILLFADRRSGPGQGNRYSHVVDLTGTANSAALASATRTARKLRRRRRNELLISVGNWFFGDRRPGKEQERRRSFCSRSCHGAISSALSSCLPRQSPVPHGSTPHF